jgi:hypothetical protein
VAHSDVHWNLKWTLPDLGFQAEAAASVHGPWTNLNTANAIQAGATKSVKIPDSALPGTTANYFRMFKPVASQLQVLLPGETNAPGTLTGKIGTPDPQSLGTPFDLTVNACDANWNIASSCSDVVHITSTDPAASPSATVPSPTDSPLVRGTITFSGTGNNPFWFGSSGTWTITASDVTTNAVTSGTSTPVTIP